MKSYILYFFLFLSISSCLQSVGESEMPTWSSSVTHQVSIIEIEQAMLKMDFDLAWNKIEKLEGLDHFQDIEKMCILLLKVEFYLIFNEIKAARETFSSIANLDVLHDEKLSVINERISFRLKVHEFDDSLSVSQADTLLRKTKDLFGESDINTIYLLLDIGLFYKTNIYDHLIAIEYYREVEKNIVASLHNTLLENECFFRLARLHMFLRDPLSSKNYSDLSLIDIQSENRYGRQFYVERLIRSGFIHSFYKDFSRAESLLQDAIQLCDGIADSRLLQNAHFYNTAIDLFTRDSARFYTRLNTLEDLVQNEDSIHVNIDLLKTNWYAFDGQYKKAIPFARRAFDFYEYRYPDYIAIASLNNHLALGVLELGHYDEAIDLIQADLDLYAGQVITLEDLVDEEFISICREKHLYVLLERVARIYLARYKVEKKIEDLNRANQFFDVMIKVITSSWMAYDEDTFLKYLERNNEGLGYAIEVSYLLFEITGRQDYLDDAINRVDLFKAYIMNHEQYVFSQLKKPKFANLLDEDKSLNRFLAEGQVSKKYDNDSIIDEYEILKRKRKVRKDLYELNGETNFFKFENSAIDFSQINDNVCILSYFVNKKHAFVTLATKDGRRIISLGAGELISNKVIAFQEFIETRNYDINMFQLKSNELFNMLFAPFYDSVKGFDLLISPSGVLFNLSFDTLIPTVNEKVDDFADLNYLIKDHSMSFIYSLAGCSKIINDEIAILNENSTVTSFHFSDKKSIVNIKKVGLPELVGSIKEKNVIEEEFRNTKTFSGQRANLKNYFESLENASDLYHMSLHAFSDPSKRNGHSVYFRSDEGIDTLHGFELLDYNLEGKSFILSACETGVGKTENTEGVFSLTRSFINAGAKEVIQTDWSIDDSATAQVFTVFYRSKGTLSYNLRQGQLYLINLTDEKINHPFYWAGFKHYYGI